MYRKVPPFDWLDTDNGFIDGVLDITRKGWGG